LRPSGRCRLLQGRKFRRVEAPSTGITVESRQEELAMSALLYNVTFDARDPEGDEFCIG